MNQFDTLKNFIASCEEDFAKFYDKGNNAAGTRIRKQMQELKKMANTIRTGVQEKKKAKKD